VPDVSIDMNARMEAQAENLQPVFYTRISSPAYEFVRLMTIDMAAKLEELAENPQLVHAVRIGLTYEGMRFMAVFKSVLLVFSVGYELTRSDPHELSVDQCEDALNMLVPVATLVAAADFTVRHVRHISQNANGLFNRMRGAAANYFPGWVRPAVREEGGDMGEYHVRPHML
jgi:hypothetical protein